MAHAPNLAKIPDEKVSVETPKDWKKWMLDRLAEEKIDTNVAAKVVKCESGFNPKAIGDSGKSYGLWQIHLPAHPSMTIEKATDPYQSTEYAIKLIKGKRGWKHWTCYNKLF